MISPWRRGAPKTAYFEVSLFETGHFTRENRALFGDGGRTGLRHLLARLWGRCRRCAWNERIAVSFDHKETRDPLMKDLPVPLVGLGDLARFFDEAFHLGYPAMKAQEPHPCIN